MCCISNPKITLKNWGSANLTTATIKYKIDNGSLQSQAWTGNLASLATTSVTLVTQTVTAGSHTLTAYSTSPNSTTDPNTSNDTSKVTFSVITTGQSLPFAEGFESSTTYPPTGWTLNNPDAGVTWARTTTAAKTGTASMMMDNFNYSAGNGQKDDATMPAVNLSTLTNPQLTFQVAYELYTNPTLSPNYSDTLQILISTDCGVTYTNLYKKFGTTLATTTPTWANAAFTPTSAQWRLETISLASYATSTNTLIMFRSISGYENFLYVDDINISGSSTTGIQQANETNGINIFPNPNSGSFVIDIQHNANEVNSISVVNSIGQTVYQTTKLNTNGNYSVDLSSYSSGIYFVQIIKSGMVYQKKILINK